MGTGDDGPPGDRAAQHVEKGSRLEPDCAMTPPQIKVENIVLGTLRCPKNVSWRDVDKVCETKTQRKIVKRNRQIYNLHGAPIINYYLNF